MLMSAPSQPHNNANRPDATAPEAAHHRAGWPPYFVLAVALILTIVATAYVDITARSMAATARTKDRLRFENSVIQTQESIASRLDTYVSVLHGAAGLFAASKAVERNEFKNFIARLNLQENYPGILGVGYSARVEPAERSGIIERMKAQGIADFHIWPDAAREEYHSILFLEPLNVRNRAAIGYDMFSEPVRRAAMERARDTGFRAASGKVTLKQEIDPNKQPGFLVYVPVYKSGNVPKSESERRRDLLGFVYSPFRVGDLLTGILGETDDSQIAFNVYDGDKLTPDNVLYQSAPAGDGPDATEPAFTMLKTLPMAGRIWSIQYRSRSDFQLSSVSNLAPFILIAGLIVSLILFQVTLSQAIAQASAERTADELRLSEEALRSSESRAHRLVASNIIGVAFLGPRGDIVETNDAFLQMLGLHHGEFAEGKLNWLELTSPESRHLDEKALATITSKGNYRPYEKEFVRRDGSRVPALVGMAFIGDSSTDAVGMGFILDLTDRRQHERRLAAQQSVTRILANAENIEAATPGILQAICECLGWDTGVLWRVEHDSSGARSLWQRATKQHELDILPPSVRPRSVSSAETTVSTPTAINDSPQLSGVLRSVQTWHVKPGAFPQIEVVTRQMRLSSGIGLAGRVWVKRQPLCVTDVTGEPDFPKAAIAARDGVYGGCAFPIMLGNEVLGVLEFFSRDIGTMDDDLLNMMATIGSQIRQFIQRKDVEQAERESNERLRLALASSNLGDWEWDIVNDILTMSGRVRYILGLPLLDDTGTPHETPITFAQLQEIIHEQDRDRVGREISQAVIQQDDYNTEYRVVWPDGSLHWVAAQGRVFFGERGEPLRMVGVAADITERRQVEEERARLLERERAARSEAEETNRVKDEFLATLSHELRTPLNSILGWAHLLRSGRMDEADSAQGLEAILRNAGVQKQLIEDLLDMSRIISGKVYIELEPVSLVPALTAAVDAARPAASMKGIHLDATFDAEDGQVAGDATRLQQLVGNLLTNAIKFTPTGGDVHLKLESASAEARIIISDTGTGIDPAFLPHIFDRFRQADASSTREAGGLGLGLAIVHHLVTLHNGTIEAYSAGKGHGATFTVRLPLIRTVEAEPAIDLEVTEANAAEVAVVNSIGILNDLRILVVEDQSDSRELFIIALHQKGAEVVAAGSASEGMDLLQTRKPDLLICDIGMPEEDDYSFIARVRALSPEQGSATPAIALTAYASDEDRQRVLEAGFQRHLAKPVQLDELVAVVAELSGHSIHV